MELLEKRESFIKNLKPFLSKVTLNEKFWENLRKHQKSIFIDSAKVLRVKIKNFTFGLNFF